MNLWEGVRIALESLRGHKLRTFLTLLGNIVGTMSVIAVVSLIYGTDRYVSEVVLDEGTDVFTVSRVNPIEFLTDFDAFLDDLKQTLNKFAVPQADQAELFAIVESTKKDIVLRGELPEGILRGQVVALLELGPESLHERIRNHVLRHHGLIEEDPDVALARHRLGQRRRVPIAFRLAVARQ